MKKLISIVVILIAVGAGGAVFYAKRSDKEPTVTTLRTSAGSIVDVVGATGTLQAVTTVTVGTQVSGIVQELQADFNSIVKKGQVVARLDPSILETQVETAKANLTNANANLERQRVTLADSQAKLARARELNARQLTTKVDLENAELTVKQAEAQLKSTQSAIVQAQAAVNKARVDLNHTVITAPIDGIVISRNVDRGQTVAASMSAPTLFIIAADLTKMQVNASIDESDVGRMRPGQAVTFRVDAYPQDTFQGSVRQVRLNPQTVQNVVTYSTVIDVPNPELKLKPGMTANVTIEIARRDNVLRVPNAALRFRPTKDIFDALNQAMPPELERGGRGNRGGQNPATGAAQGGATPSTVPGQPPGTVPGRANQPGAAQQPPGTATAGRVEVKAQAARRQENTATGPAQQGQPNADRSSRGSARAQSDPATGSGQTAGGTTGSGGGGREAGGQGGRGGGFASMTPEERQQRMEERMAAMTPEERAAFQERMKQRQAQGGGPGGPGGGGSFDRSTGSGQGGGGRRSLGDGGGNAGSFQRNREAVSGQAGRDGTAGNVPRNGVGNAGNPPRGQGGGGLAGTSKSAATTSATTIDALFAPLPTIETRGRAWLFINKQLKPVSLRLGITDGTFTEVLNDAELQSDTDVVTAIITPEMASKPVNQNNANGNPLLPSNRGRGPGGPGSSGGRTGGR